MYGSKDPDSSQNIRDPEHCCVPGNAVSQVAQQELELVRSSSGDRELVEHIKGLEEQLASKSQELQKQRNAHLYIQEIKVYNSL